MDVEDYSDITKEVGLNYLPYIRFLTPQKLQRLIEIYDLRLISKQPELWEVYNIHIDTEGPL